MVIVIYSLSSSFPVKNSLPISATEGRDTGGQLGYLLLILTLTRTLFRAIGKL